jgi:hypothetical protein
MLSSLIWSIFYPANYGLASSLYRVQWRTYVQIREGIVFRSFFFSLSFRRCVSAWVQVGLVHGQNVALTYCRAEDA